MNDKIIECFVKGRKNKKLPLILAAVTIAFCIVDFFIFSYFGVTGLPIVIALTAVGMYILLFLVKNNNLEYEYSVFSGDFEINEIRNQTRRKFIFKCHVSDIQNFKKILSKDFDEKKIYKDSNTEYFYCFGDEDEVLYSFTVRGENGKNKQIYIAHEEEIIKKLGESSYEIRKLL